MVCHYIVAVLQTWLLLNTDHHAFASQDSQHEPLVPPGKAGPAQEAHTSTSNSEAPRSTGGITSHLHPRRLSDSQDSNAAVANAGAAAAANAGAAAPPPAPPQGASAAPAAVPFECENSAGDVVTYNFHRVILATHWGVYMDVQEGHSGLRVVLFAPYCRGAPANEPERSEHAAKLKKDITAGLIREQAFFPRGASRQALLAKYGFIIPKSHCSLQRAPDVLNLEGPEPHTRLLNLLIELPAGHVTLCAMDLSKLDAAAIVAISTQIIKRLHSLHSLNVIHRRVDCSAFFINTMPKSVNARVPEVYLGNFAHAQVDTGVPQLFDVGGLLHTLDPNLAHAAFSPVRERLLIVAKKKQDSWAAGILLYSLMCHGSTDPFGIFASPASERVLLRRITRLEISPREVNFRNCIPTTAHPSVSGLRSMITKLLEPSEPSRFLPENAVQIYAHLFRDS